MYYLTTKINNSKKIFISIDYKNKIVFKNKKCLVKIYLNIDVKILRWKLSLI